jgi:hypothetical protein
MGALWLVGAAGIVAIEGSYVPQILRLHRLKRSDELSYFFPSLNAVGRLMALIFSVAQGQQVFVGGFLLGILLRLTLLVQIAIYRRPATARPKLEAIT